MSYRQNPIIVGQTYHVFNRSIAREPIFLSRRDYQRALEVFEYYSFSDPGLRFSFYNRLAAAERNKFIDTLRMKNTKSVQILSYCFMPSHVHFLIRETEEKGIVKFMSNCQNSYAKYFNTKNERTGALFQSMFKAVRIETDEQLLHVARYIHLNPLTSYVVKNVEALEDYPWSSYREYLGLSNMQIANTDEIMNFYRSVAEFKRFVLDQADYQKKLERIKHLMNENL